MNCDICRKVVDTDEYPLSVHATEDIGAYQSDGKPYDCLCPACWNNVEQIYGHPSPTMSIIKPPNPEKYPSKPRMQLMREAAADIGPDIKSTNKGE